MRIPHGTASFEKDSGDTAGLPVINLYAEAAPSEETGLILQSRPGLVMAALDVGASAVLESFSKDGVFNADVFSMSGGNLYRGSILVGSVSGSGVPSICGNEIGVFACAGTVLRYYNGTTLATVTFAGNAIKALTAAGRLVVIEGNSGKFFWSEVLTATIDVLDFATAENSPDRLLDAVFVDDILVLFGKETVEFWPNTQDAELPFQPLEARVIEKGIKATGCAIVHDSDILWIANDNTVRRGSSGQIISDHGLEEKIAASATHRVWSFLLNGHEMAAARLDQGTWVYSNRSGLWSEFQSYGRPNWTCQTYAGGIFGTDLDGQYVTFSGFADPDTVLERRFRAGFPLNGGASVIYNVRLRVNPGNTVYLSGDYVDPKCEVRLSRDKGKTWGRWRSASLGRQGDYRQIVEWRGLGQVQSPGVLFEFRVTDPVPFAPTGVFVNEARP